MLLVYYAGFFPDSGYGYFLANLRLICIIYAGKK